MNLTDSIHAILQSLNFSNFSYLSNKNNIEFNTGEYVAIRGYLKEVDRHFNLGIINDLSNIKFYWNTKMNKDTTTACWSEFKFNSVFVCNDFHFDYKTDGFKRLIEPIGHELRHRWQCKKFTIFYFLCKFPIIKNMTLELDANNIGEKINKYYKISEEI